MDGRTGTGTGTGTGTTARVVAAGRRTGLRAGAAVLVVGGLALGLAPMPLGGLGCRPALLPAGDDAYRETDLGLACAEQRADRQGLVAVLVVLGLATSTGLRAAEGRRLLKPAPDSV